MNTWKWVTIHRWNIENACLKNNMQYLKYDAIFHCFFTIDMYLSTRHNFYITLFHKQLFYNFFCVCFILHMLLSLLLCLKNNIVLDLSHYGMLLIITCSNMYCLEIFSYKDLSRTYHPVTINLIKLKWASNALRKGNKSNGNKP